MTFADGVVHSFDYDADVMKEIGSLYQKYLYFSNPPTYSWDRPVDYFEFADASVPSISSGTQYIPPQSPVNE